MTGTRLRDQVANIPTVRSHTAQFVRMEGPLALINTGNTQIRIPCVGYYPPRTGMTVQVEWRDGKPAVIGPAVTRNPIGEITGTGSPKAEVTVDGVAYLLPYESWYEPVIADVVSVDWQREVIVGKLSTSPAAVEEPDPPSAPVAPFDVTVRATGSGKYDDNYNNWWGGSEVWASNNNDGVWVYGNTIRDAVGPGAQFTRIDMFLPLISQTGSCSIGLHSHPSIPGGAPSIGSLVTLNQRGGWVQLPTEWAAFLTAEPGRGVGVVAPSGGLTKWRGVAQDSLSGALRLQGNR